MAAKKKDLALLEVLRAIRDDSSKKIMDMTFEEQQAYFAEGARWFTEGLKKKPASAKRKPASRPVNTRRKSTAKKVVANHAKTTARKAK